MSIKKKKNAIKKPDKQIEELKKRLLEISHLSSIMMLLDWDQNVNLPPKGADIRAASSATLSGIIHDRLTSIDSDGLLTALKSKADKGVLSSDESVIVFETWRDYDRARKLPDAFVREMVEVTSKAQSIWAEARTAKNYKLFQPLLEKIIRLKRKEAEYVGYDDSPYDAMLDTYDPGMTAKRAQIILDDIRDFLVPFIKKIQTSKVKPNESLIKGDFPVLEQAAFNAEVVKKMGFDMDAGRIDETTHPFAAGVHPTDVRIATRYSPSDPFYSLGSTIHEAGHGLYEQGLPVEHFGNPLGEVVSICIHESQSRLWENPIGKSRNFWKYFFPKFKKAFPKQLSKMGFEDFFRLLNRVKPSLIRTEADEVTYNLHVILRFELEKGLIEGTIDTRDLPAIWNRKMKEYFGIDVPDDGVGVLQDIHWSAGLFGYFPSYSFGNLYAAQFYAAMRKSVKDLDKKISSGDFRDALAWLRKHVHAHGKTYTGDALVRKATGEQLNSRYFIDYLESKYNDIYFPKAQK